MKYTEYNHNQSSCHADENPCGHNGHVDQNSYQHVHGAEMILNSITIVGIAPSKYQTLKPLAQTKFLLVFSDILYFRYISAVLSH